MSPFSGSTTQEVWERFDPGVFLQGSASVTKAQAAFLSSYGLPRVDAVAVGTDNVEHLRELAEVLSYKVDENVVREYRQLLKARQPA
ncbi:hypothetical protein M8I34_21025 [Streptomyces sp. MCA2]|uniref:hypothetical protein n=1 Tax=Streptomyces sp. MCA2 TaxID=2944805 RepID=UPI0020214E1A|nr:hypothetical protein [Streptomyces sp. MCA2]MCL7493856.1 hypothetical protein [Streptomyces sp. MCA2]